MNLKALNIGIVHSLIGQNDGVSIVIDQSVEAMIEYLKIPLGNIYFLAGHAPERFNTMQDDIFWHKNYPNKHIVENYQNQEVGNDFDELIQKNAAIAEDKIAEFVEKNNIDLLILHNMAHPYNFIAAVGIGKFIEKKRDQKLRWPKVLLWWHDSYFERPRFKNPNPIVKKYLKYLPGNHTDGIVFINSEQPEFAKQYYKENEAKDIMHFFDKKADIIPNTTDIPWDWTQDKKEIPCPPSDNYNSNFLNDVGIMKVLNSFNAKEEDLVLLLQHTRIVPRKRIDKAIDFAFQLEARVKETHPDKVVVLLVSGHSGDEDEVHKKMLIRHFQEQLQAKQNAKVSVLFGEHVIFPSRIIVVDRKFYRFADIPAIVANYGGIGTYFSEIEGYGNNLLEMLSSGLPVAVNRYPIFDREIAPLGLKLMETRNSEITDKIVDEAKVQLFDKISRKETIIHNLNIIEEKLHHRIIAEKLGSILRNLFLYE